MAQRMASKGRTCPRWQVGGEAHSPRTTVRPARHVLHSKLKGTERPRLRIEAQSFHGVSCGDTDEVEKNETHARIHIDFPAHARDGSRRIRRPAEQTFLHAERRGPGPGRQAGGPRKRVLPIVERQRAARGAHGLAWAFLDWEAARGQLRPPGVWKRCFFHLGEERHVAVWRNEKSDATADLCEGYSEGLRKAQSQTVRLFPLESIAGEIFLHAPAKKPLKRTTTPRFRLLIDR